MSATCIPIQSADKRGDASRFPLDQWYDAGFTRDLQDRPLARTFLNQKEDLYRNGALAVAALEDRCCQRARNRHNSRFRKCVRAAPGNGNEIGSRAHDHALACRERS